MGPRVRLDFLEKKKKAVCQFSYSHYVNVFETFGKNRYIHTCKLDQYYTGMLISP